MGQSVAWRVRQGRPRSDPLRTFHVERSAGDSALLGGPGADGTWRSARLKAELDMQPLRLRLPATGPGAETSASRA